ncbi:hypothetical protein CRI93_00185 [Longimonas halophila]|uniref:Uncharacterized protein n=1 Tax=Longimonas halophila TaxID=1469170 RepID=A0A2H3NSI8_9BACT|nr:NACHT domain-containing protein [Longimonas halophila]PEN09186.1 hypothetical protein CRI93_00185 [Longimonas halophila]
MSGDTREPGILIGAPVSDLAEQLGIDYRGLFADLGKATVSGLIGVSTGSPGAIGGAMKNVISTYTRFGDAKTLHAVQDQPGPLAWLLIHESLLDAMSRLILDHGARFRDAYSGKELPVEDAMRDQLHNELSIRLADENLRITASFFDRPAEIDILHTVQEDLKDWFVALGVERGEAQAACGHLPSYFRKSLIDTWRSHLDAFQFLKDHLKIPFSHHEKAEAAWERYRAIVQEEVDKPVFGEAVSLRQMYIWPRAYTLVEDDSDEIANEEISPEVGEMMAERLKRDHDETKRVVDLKTAVLDWLNGADPDDAIRIISADPGIGKSSFCCMLADELATSKKMPVLYVPLHNLDTSKGLREAVHEYLHDAKLFPRDIYPLDGDSLLLILDGLDELSMQGAVGAREAAKFVREVKDKVLNLNQHTFRVRVLLSGRKIASAAAKEVLRRPSSVFYMVPFVPEDNPKSYVDPDGLLQVDQRNDW